MAKKAKKTSVNPNKRFKDCECPICKKHIRRKELSRPIAWFEN